VLATSGTLASDKYQRLLQAQPAGIHVAARACPGLARLIEQGDLQAPELLDAVELHCAALRAADVDTVVLGCTHYAFVKDAIQSAMGPAVHIIDTADAVARHTLDRIGPRFTQAAPAPSVRLLTTGSRDTLRLIAAAWLDFDCSVSAAEGR
jgi:glutamate racemase